MWGVAVLAAIAALSVAAAVGMDYFGPRVPEERIAEQDLDLVRDEDRVRWRSLRMNTYRGWKRQDDFYRVAAYRKALAANVPPAEAKAAVKQEFPFYYLDPALREEDAYVGDDASLPIVLRERIDRNAPLVKRVMAEEPDGVRTANALIRVLIRKGII